MKDERTNIAVNTRTHSRMKRKADGMGMKMQALPEFLVELMDIASPEVKAEALRRMEQRRNGTRRESAAAG